MSNLHQQSFGVPPSRMEQGFAGPSMRLNGAAAAYGAVIRETGAPRDIEYRVIARIIAMLKDAQLPGAGPAALHEALHETRMVWTAFLMDLASPGNTWDDAGKARLVSIAAWVINAADRVRRGEAKVDGLISVMEPVAEGLKPASHAAEAPDATGTALVPMGQR